MSINPAEYTKFDCTETELQERLLFAIAVAGKRSSVIAKSLDIFLAACLRDETPFQFIRRQERAGMLTSELVVSRLSPYSQRAKSFRWVSFLSNLDEVPIELLESLPGIGPKTARFFVLHTRRDARHAVLDTHILAWLRDQGIGAPKSTPQNSKAYAKLEQIFLAECDKRGMAPAAFDMEVWKERSGS